MTGAAHGHIIGTAVYVTAIEVTYIRFSQVHPTFPKLITSSYMNISTTYLVLWSLTFKYDNFLLPKLKKIYILVNNLIHQDSYQNIYKSLYQNIYERDVHIHAWACGVMRRLGSTCIDVKTFVCYSH